MTPFGQRMRKLRSDRKVTLKQMADAIGVSSAYLSALEHGKRGRPGWHLIQRIIAYFNIIWDEAEEVVRLAQTQSEDIIRDAEAREREIRLGAEDYADEIPKTLETNLDKFLAAVQRGRERLQTGSGSDNL